MDRAAITEIFDYNEWCWRQLVQQCSLLGDDLLTKAAPGSGWPALTNCLSHMVVAYDVWLEVLEGKPRVEEDTAPAFPNWDAQDAMAVLIRKRFRRVLASLSDAQLGADIDADVFGQTLMYTPAELLGNVVVHERGHHGDVNTLLYQLGTHDLGIPDYRWFVNSRRGYK